MVIRLYVLYYLFFDNKMLKTRVASFDVGINHLAYAIIELRIDKNNNETVKIIDLDMLCLFSQNEKIKCCGKISTGESCDKISKYYGTDEPIQRGKSKSKKSDDKKTEDDSNSIDELSSEDVPDHKYYCKFHSPESAKSITRINTKTVSNSKVCIKLESALSKLDLTKCNKIVIEYQPRMASKKMQFVSHAIYYDMCSRYLNKEHTKCKSVAYAARNKYQAYDGPKINMNIKLPEKKAKSSSRNAQYKARKHMVIEMAIYMMKKYNDLEWLDYFNNSSFDKQDDLSDAYVQGLTTLLPDRR